MSGKQGDQTKGARYIQLLDQARCNGEWDAIPELVRKVRKHAPERSCLALASESEHAVYQASKGRPSTSKSIDSSELGQLIQPLSEAIEKERKYVEDEFQAQVCLAWVYWIIGDTRATALRFPGNIEQDFAQLVGTGKESEAWTRVCAVKAVCIKGMSLAKIGEPAEALETFESAMPLLLPVSRSLSSEELRTWTETFLTQFCILSSDAIKTKLSSLLEAEALLAFRAWAEFWDLTGPSTTPSGGYAKYVDISRRRVWKEYYATLSMILQQDLPYPTSALATAYTDTSTRIQQAAELQRVQSKYESLLLKEIQFPRAEQASEDVEEWVDLVMKNWRLLCGASWQEGDIGPNGRGGISRIVLDILYRAATKTFHSTSVLRHLFTVHLAVGEFELAFKAFDTYLEIVKRSKARVEKTGEIEQGLDDDETVLRTASECLRALCRYGSRRAAEKAKILAQYLQDWIKTHLSRDLQSNINGNGNVNGRGGAEGLQISPRVLAMTWRSIGISQAQLARLTHDTLSRPELQLQAIKQFRKALSPELESAGDIETLFALAVVLAERRELGPAIEVVKSALLPPVPRDTTSQHVNFARERSLIPVWHLLALLLSARQEFTTAARACEGAFEQFKDPKNLFGDGEQIGGYRSEHLNHIGAKPQSEKSHSQTRGVIDDMDDFEKETVLEVKMTQLSLIEVLEGPQVAVNACDELLRLYARLFGEPHKTWAAPPKTAQTMPPQSSAGTLRSIKGSIFGRSGRNSVRKASDPFKGSPALNEKHELASRPMTSQTAISTVTRAPTIHVTSENGQAPNRPHQDHPVHHEKLQKRSGSLSKKKSQPSVRDSRARIASKSSSNQDPANHPEPESKHLQSEYSSPIPDPGHLDRRLNPTNTGQVGLAVSPDVASGGLSQTPDTPHESLSRNLPKSTQNMPQREPALKPTQAHQQDTPLPSSISGSSAIPVTRFAKDQARRHRIEILIKVWLLITGFYRRAEMFDDAKGAVDEAYKLIEGLELDVSKDTNDNVSISDRGWGVGKSVEELWGDLWSERGYLSSAKGLPYTALADFESALVHFADHPAAIVGLSNILLDIYTEVLQPLPSTPELVLLSPIVTPSSSTINTPIPSSTPSSTLPPASIVSSKIPTLQANPLGLKNSSVIALPYLNTHQPSSPLDPPHLTSSTALLDRLAARDRAYGLLNGLTKLGTGWNYSEAWFALARAYEEGGQVEKAREVLWWCVELEEGKGIRDWDCVAVGGYVL